MEIFLNDKLGKIDLMLENSDSSRALMIFSHGAGAGMNHPFMVEIASKLVKNDIAVARFNFPYMQQGKRSPGSPKNNIEAWRLVTEHIQSLDINVPMFLSGKSYGGRMASHLLAEEAVAGVTGIIYFGFPLHAPGKDSKERAKPLVRASHPTSSFCRGPMINWLTWN